MLRLLPFLFGLLVAPLAAQDAPRPRLIVLTDIGGDPDDQQSMRRLLLYANHFEILGLVASASGMPGELGRAVTRPDLIVDILHDYAAVRNGLALHADGYPTPAALRAVVRNGSARRGPEHVGSGRSTPGSRLIVRAVDAADGPVHVVIWGGAHDLAQALFDVRAARTEAETAAFTDRLRVYAIADQDAFDGSPGTGAWIREHFPGMRYVETGPPGMNRFAALFRGMYQNDARGGGLPEAPLVSDAVAALNQEVWVEANVRRDHGALGADYPLVNQNPSSTRNTRGVKEGDTPSWFFLLPNGLSDPEHPGYGGWGGRFRPAGGGHWVDAEDDHPDGPAHEGVGRKWTVARWRAAYQHDFAARMDWCVRPFAEANHNPRPVLDGRSDPAVLYLDVAPDEEIELSASGTTDPDGDAFAYRWFVYGEAGSYGGEVSLSGAETETVRFTAPRVDEPRTIHVILAVRDDGAPPLTAYRRAVVTVRP